jgi:hypothetical protein
MGLESIAVSGYGVYASGASIYSYSFDSNYHTLGGARAIFWVGLIAIVFLLIAAFGHSSASESTFALGEMIGALFLLATAILCLFYKHMLAVEMSASGGHSPEEYESVLSLKAGPICGGVFSFIGVASSALGLYLTAQENSVTPTRRVSHPVISSDDEGSNLYSNPSVMGARSIPTPAIEQQDGEPEQIPALDSAASQSASESTDLSEDHKIELLKSYKELLDSGILTPEEFEEKKKEILKK